VTTRNSQRMSKCRSGNALELEFRRQLAAHLGTNVRFEASDLPGTPDAVVECRRTAIFMHGCFWHGCPLHYRAPRRNAAYWRAKLLHNRGHDRLVTARLRVMGWRVLVLWEHEMRTAGATRIIAALRP